MVNPSHRYGSDRIQKPLRFRFIEYYTRRRRRRGDSSTALESMIACPPMGSRFREGASGSRQARRARRELYRGLRPRPRGYGVQAQEILNAAHGAHATALATANETQMTIT